MRTWRPALAPGRAGPWGRGVRLCNDRLHAHRILGGTGPAAPRSAPASPRSVPRRARSRSKYRAMESRDALVERCPSWTRTSSRRQRVRGDEPRRRDRHTLDSAASTAQSVQEHLEGKVVISMANASSGWTTSSSRWCRRVVRWLPTCRPPYRSAASWRRSTTCRPGSSDTSARHRLRRPHLLRRPRRHEGRLRDRRQDPGCAARRSELSNATAIEAFTAVLLQLNVRYKTGSRRSSPASSTEPRPW